VEAYLLDQYRTLSVPPAIDAALRPRNDTTAVLCYQGVGPYKLGSSILNRFLVSRLLQLPGTELRKGVLSRRAVKRSKAGGYTVTFENGEEKHFEGLTVRHGPKRALEGYFRHIWDACAPLRVLNELDYTRTRIWPSGAFGPEPPPSGGGSPSGSLGGPPIIVGAGADRGLSLATYLSRLREKVGHVTLAGDTEPRPLQDVYVELEVTRGGAVDAEARDTDEDSETAKEARFALGMP
jgi:hypothetical protein